MARGRLLRLPQTQPHGPSDISLLPTKNGLDNRVHFNQHTAGYRLIKAATHAPISVVHAPEGTAALDSGCHWSSDRSLAWPKPAWERCGSVRACRQDPPHTSGRRAGTRAQIPTGRPRTISTLIQRSEKNVQRSRSRQFHQNASRLVFRVSASQIFPVSSVMLKASLSFATENSTWANPACIIERLEL